jgi:hypothetical protein
MIGPNNLGSGRIGVRRILFGSVLMLIAGLFIVSGFALPAHSSAQTTQSNVRFQTGGTMVLNTTGTVVVTTGLPSGYSTGKLGVITYAATGLTAGSLISAIEKGVNGGSGPSAAWGFETGTVGTGGGLPLTGGVIWTSANGFQLGGATTVISMNSHNFAQIGPDAWEPICGVDLDGNWICM